MNPEADEIFIQNITLSMELNQLSECVEASARKQQCRKLDAIYPRVGKSCWKKGFVYVALGRRVFVWCKLFGRLSIKLSKKKICFLISF